MELETVNKLFLELSQFATATTARESEMKADIGQAHHVLDLMNVPRVEDHSDGELQSKLTLLGRMRWLQEHVDCLNQEIKNLKHECDGTAGDE